MKTPTARKIIIIFILMISGCAAKTYSGTESYSVARKFYKKGEYERAIHFYNEYLTENPHTQLKETILFRLGQCYQKTGKDEEARSAYQALVDSYNEGFWVDRAMQALEEI